MNINFNKGNRKEVESVSTRVKKTKQEIEQLKNELEKLINLGTEPSYPKPVFERKIPEFENILLKPEQIFPQEPQLKSNAATQKKVEPTKIVPLKSVPVIQNKPEPTKISPKKTRNYNIVEAREYIKKQKEKRAEQLKAQINVADNQLDLKKQKLRELHQKTIELVAKNVQQKRERSKSRDKEPPICLDRCVPRHKSQETISRARQNVNSKSQERQKSATSSARVKSQDRGKSQERAKLQTQVKTTLNERVSRARTRNEPAKSTETQKIDPNLLYPPNVKFGSNTEKVIELEKTVFPESKDIDLNKRITSVPSVSQENGKVESDGKKHRSKKPKNVLEHSIMTDACLKDTKETQTNHENNFERASWMEPLPALPYPYNFINTVKRKLQYAINSPKSCVDVGVQNSADSSPQTPEVEKVKSKEEIKELLIKSTSNMRSFASHRGPNLDLKVVENLELKPNKHKSNETVCKNLFETYESESDTSKNIPEISSESLGSIHKPQLSLDKLKDLKLQKISKSQSIKTDTNGYSVKPDGYSSDFQKESVSSRSSSTIQTIASEKKVSYLSHHSSIDNSIKESSYRPTDFAKKDLRRISSDVSCVSSISEATSGHSENQNYPSINKDRISGEGSQQTFKSLLTESQISKTTSELNTELSSSKPVSESLDLKEPSVSLAFKKDGIKTDLRKNLMNTVTLRSDDSNFKDKNEDSQGTFQSELTEDKISKSAAESVQENLDEKTKSQSISSNKCLTLKEPRISLVIGKEQNGGVKSQMRNITLRPTNKTNNINEIHLKFEAEVRLLNDFNESFKQFVAVEKAFENLKNKNETNLAMTKILQNVDTQTSVMTKTSTNVTTPRNSSINYSRGSEIEELDVSANNRNVSKSLQNSTFSTDWNLSNLNESSVTNVSTVGGMSKSISSIENCNVQNCAGILSLNIFDQLIKDEDTRIQQLKAIIKIREHALLDRTKSELVWLEIQKKQLIETGKIEEASLLKKKQRGIILKHEQERNEIKKLKQMQKEASEHRKNNLKRQRNFIKTQLSTENMLSKITVKKQRKERRSTGPLRVVQSCSESIHSEASISLKSSGIDDVLSITSRSLRVSEESELEVSKGAEDVPVSNAKRTLLMREAELQRRRKAAEGLLRWHRRLLDEERKIGELEEAATSVVRGRQPPADRRHHRFDGRQLNQMWRSMTGSDEKRFVEDKVYAMSQVALERLCKSARQHAKRNAHAHQEQSPDYSSAFETDLISQEEKTKISSSISELIDNFSRIEDEISTLSKKSEDIVSLKDTEGERREDSEGDVSSIREIEESVVEVVEKTKKDERDEDEILTKDEDLELKKEDLEEAKTIREVSTAIEEQQEKISTDEEIPTEEDTIEEQIIATDEEVSLEKEDSEVEEKSSVIEETKNRIDEDVPKTEDLEELKTATDRQISTTKDREEPDSAQKVSATIRDEEISIEEISSFREDIEEADSDDKVSTIEDLKIAEEQITTEDLEVQKSISTKNEDLEESKLSEVKEAEEASKISEDVEGLRNQKSLDELSSTQYEDVGKLPTEVASEEISAKNEESEKISEQIDEKLETSITEDLDESENKEESSVSLVSEEKEESVVASKDIATSLSLEEALESASKIEESLIKLNQKLASEKKDEEISEEVSTGKDIESIEESKRSPTSVSTETDEKTPQKKSPNQIDVKKRVSEILADASPSRGDKSPRLQDLYVTAYDVGAPLATEANESLEEGRQLPTDIFGSEAEELWRKQLAIEQEIKQIELQQKEQLPYLYVREIPNKPPPPYTPPSSLSSLPISILPSDVKEITEIASYSSKVLYKAHQNDNLDKVKFSENGFKLFSKIQVTKICAEFVFNICKDFAKDHYRQFEEVEEPSWLILAKKPQLAKTKPADADALDKILNQKLKELFGFKKAQTVESAIIKWGRKKRDHVDEVLVIESQEEESQWTNFDKDELIVKNQVSEDIMKMLFEETADVFTKILKKKCVDV